MPTNVATAWTPAEPDRQAVFARYSDPLRALANAEIPAIILRQVFNPTDCQGLIQRFINWLIVTQTIRTAWTSATASTSAPAWAIEVVTRKDFCAPLKATCRPMFPHQFCNSTETH